jgi:hypothetical protein
LVRLVPLWLGLRLRWHLRRSLLACWLRHWGLRVRGLGFLLEYRLRLISFLLALPHFRARQKRLLLLVGLGIVWLGLRPRRCFRRCLLTPQLRHWGVRVVGFGILLLEYRLRLISFLLALPHRPTRGGGRAVPQRLLRGVTGGLLLAR